MNHLCEATLANGATVSIENGIFLHRLFNDLAVLNQAGFCLLYHQGHAQTGPWRPPRAPDVAHFATPPPIDEGLHLGVHKTGESRRDAVFEHRSRESAQATRTIDRRGSIFLEEKVVDAHAVV